MPIIFITGVSGSGKSAVHEELLERGFEAYDTDKDKISSYFNIKSGEEVFTDPKNRIDRSEQWYREHEWRINLQHIESLRVNEGKKLIFVCGMSSNRLEIATMCDMFITLLADPETLKKRIVHRRKSYGKQPHEMKRILESQIKKLNEDHKAGSKIIDASNSISKIVDDIITLVQEKF